MEKINKAKSVTVLTGSGISAASGIPTFRGRDGLWKNYRPEQLATPAAFREKPELVWEWYLWRRQLIEKVKPNAGHYALVKLEEIYHSFTLVTQNVDNLHSLAGSQKIIELHGNIMRNKCFECGKPFLASIIISNKLPRCPVCYGLIRPDVVWFGEQLPVLAIQSAQRAAEECDIFMVVGTSGFVEPAASLPRFAKANGAFLIEINIEKTPLTASMDEFYAGPADEILPELIESLTDQNFQ